MKNNILSTIGIAHKARATVIGEDNITAYVQKKKISLIFLANDAAENTKKKYIDKGNFYHIHIDENFTKSELSKAIGRENCSAIAINNQGFTKAFMKKIQEV